MPDAARPTLQDLLDKVVGHRLEDIRFLDHDRRDQATSLVEVVLRFDSGQTLHFWVDEVEGWNETDGSTLHIDALRDPRRQIEG